MKGVIFNLLEDFISTGWGPDTYEAVLAKCPLHTKEPFVGPGTYPDADLLAIVEKTTEKLGITVPEAVHAFGKYCFPKLAAKFPVFVAGHDHPKTFLKTIDDVIHVEVRKLFRDANPPRITFTDPGPDQLILTYESGRRLCALMTGLLDGAAEYFKIPIEATQTECMLDGASACVFHLRFATPIATGA